MIIELFGLPGSGKSTRARALEQEGKVVRVRINSRTELLVRNALFFFQYPVTTIRLAVYLLKYGGRGTLFRTKVISLFLGHNAKYQKARWMKGVYIIDQGHFQNLLSLFEVPLTEVEMRAYVALLPKPDELWICTVEEGERARRLRERGYGGGNEDRAQDAVQKNFSLAQRILPEVFGTKVRILSNV